MNGWWVANHVRPIAVASSVVLRAMLEIGSGDGEFARMRSGPDQELVEGQCRMASEQDFSGLAIDIGRAYAKDEVDAFVVEEGLVAQHEAFFRREFGKEVLRQRRPLIGQPRLVGYDGDRFGIEPEITIKLARKRYIFFEVGISYAGRTYEEGKKIGLKDAFRAIFAIIKYSFS